MKGTWRTLTLYFSSVYEINGQQIGNTYYSFNGHMWIGGVWKGRQRKAKRFTSEEDARKWVEEMLPPIHEC